MIERSIADDKLARVADAAHAVIAEVQAWKSAPGKTYNLDHNNCVHFVAKIASLVGIRVEVPQEMVRKPKAWLNYITRMNPQLGAREIK